MRPASSEEPISTQAEPETRPDVTVPGPRAASLAPVGASKFDSQVLLDVQKLCDRVGGPDKLKELINVLTGLQS
jgi:hypothetical protein